MRPQTSLRVALVVVCFAVISSTRVIANGSEGMEPITAVQQAKLSPQALLATIAIWLTTNFDLSATTTLPTLKLIQPDTIVALPYHSLAPTGGDAGDFVALYDGSSRTIYLSKAWRGDTPAQVSILVHEMVHHLQEMTAQSFGCMEDKEEMAYAAQDRWLALAGSSLKKEFGVDAFTVMARSTCLY